MSKKSNKKSPKNKVSKKKVVKKPTAKKSASKTKKKTAPAKKAKAKKIAPKKKPVKKVVVKKEAKPVKKEVAKPASKNIVPAGKKDAPKVKPIVKPVTAPVVKPVRVVTEKPVKVIVEKAPKLPKRAKPTGPRNLVPVISKKSVVIDIKTGPEPKGRFELEYVIHSSAPILFEFLTSPSGLSEWFCDDVNIRNGIYSFKWEENEQLARVVKLIEEKQVRFQWVDKTDNSYFEFRIERDDLTNDISLIVVDFAETEEEKISSSLLWNSQIAKLMHVLGSYF